MIYALRYYSGPLLLALAIHALAAAALLRGFNPTVTETRIVKPQIVKSELIVLEAKAKPTPPPKQKPKPMLNKPVPLDAKPKPVAKPKPAPVPQTKPKPDPLKAEQEAQKKRETERQKRLDELANQQFLEALESEASDLDAVITDKADDVAAQSFRMGIYQAIVGNWSRPPSARRGMEARLLVELVPTGDIVSVTVVQSSGNAAFDRSAEGAVNKARRFEVPKESALFERYFRKFTLLFKPEDLLR
ncbi:MAG: cell envelope integrity protein TolA [Pseudomonadales bacterium]